MTARLQDTHNSFGTAAIGVNADHALIQCRIGLTERAGNPVKQGWDFIF